jgi:integrase
VKKVKAVITEEADTMKRTRMIALYSLLALQGLRQFEAVALTVEDLRLNDRIAFVRGKGRDDKERIDLHPETVSALEDYLQTSGKKSGFLFTSISRATKGSTDPLTERAVRKLFAAIFQKAGLPEGRSVHGFRHFFVSQILEVTSGDLLTVQKFSRHKSLQAIKFYDDRKRKAELLPMFYNAFAS